MATDGAGSTDAFVEAGLASVYRLPDVAKIVRALREAERENFACFGFESVLCSD
jgi:hypothetical protein